jgi:hypothetical protein
LLGTSSDKVTSYLAERPAELTQSYAIIANSSCNDDLVDIASPYPSPPLFHHHPFASQFFVTKNLCQCRK